MLVQADSDRLDYPVRFVFKEIFKISINLFSGGKRNIGLSFSLRSF